jgi:hypothetical protein
MRRLIALPLALALAVPAAGQEKAATAGAKAVAPFLGEDAVAVAHIDLTRIDLNALAARLGGANADALTDVKKGAGKAVKSLTRAGVRDVYVVGTLTGFPNGPWAYAVVPLPAGADADAVTKALRGVLHVPSAHVGEAVVAGDATALRRLKNLKAVSHPELARGLAAAGDGAAQVVVFLPKHLRRALGEVAPDLPPALGGGSAAPLIAGFSWAAAGLNLTPKLSLRAVVRMKNAESARELARLADKAVQGLTVAVARDKDAARFLPKADALRELFTPRVKGNRLTLTLDDRELMALVVPAVVKVRAAARRAQSTNNLKQLAIAMHAYQDVNKTFPAHASYDKQGRPLLSWRVHVLPYIERQSLYDEFHLDEPWDSPHNKKLIARMPATFRSPASRAAPGKTTYVVVGGKDTMFPPGPKGVQVKDVTDGLSNTIMIVEADDAHAVPWTRPEDLPFDPQHPFRGLGGKAAGYIVAALGDGSVRLIARSIQASTLRALFTRNGGEVIGDIP